MTRHNLGQDCHDAGTTVGEGGCRKAPKKSFSNHLLCKDRSCGQYQEISCHVSTYHILSEYIWKPHSGFFKILGLSRKVKRSLTYSAKSSLHLQSSQRGCNSASGGVTADREDFGVMYVRHRQSIYLVFGPRERAFGICGPVFGICELVLENSWPGGPGVMYVRHRQKVRKVGDGQLACESCTLESLVAGQKDI